LTVRSLDETLRYENDEVVHRYAVDHGVTKDDAEEIFLETKRWLWLCATEMAAKPGQKVDRIPLLSEARVLDLMWHTFLLFTRDYMEFCHTHFGFYLHHQPRLRVEKEAWDERVAADREGAVAERRKTLREAYEIVCDRLGQQTLKKWCVEFPARFPE
jgi:hypothetical protein